MSDPLPGSAALPFSIGGGGVLRVPLGPGLGGRNVDLVRLAEVIHDDAGWRLLCELMESDRGR